MHTPTIRRPAVAGTWYPGTEPELRREVEGYLAAAGAEPLAGRLLGLIVPHAGYVYSGQTAAHAYARLRGRSFGTVAVLAPSHRAWYDACAVSAEEAYETPLGRVPVDHALAGALAAHLPLRHIRSDAEHAIEIQVPFLQVALGPFRLLPLLLSSDDPALPARLAQALAEVAAAEPWATEGLLLVASSDLHHIDRYDEVVRRDERVVDAVAAYDLEALSQILLARDSTVCGRIPILTVLHAARLRGADAVRVLHHTTSGDVTGRRRAGEYTVGYLSAAVYARDPLQA